MKLNRRRLEHLRLDMFQIGTSLARQKVLETAPCRANGRMHARLESRWCIDRHHHSAFAAPSVRKSGDRRVALGDRRLHTSDAISG